MHNVAEHFHCGRRVFDVCPVCKETGLHLKHLRAQGKVEAETTSAPEVTNTPVQDPEVTATSLRELAEFHALDYTLGVDQGSEEGDVSAETSVRDGKVEDVKVTPAKRGRKPKES